jgi:hypothetical protein
VSYFSYLRAKKIIAALCVTQVLENKCLAAEIQPYNFGGEDRLGVKSVMISDGKGSKSERSYPCKFLVIN